MMKQLKLFVVPIICLIFLIGTVSAFEIDNVQSYDKEKREYLIENAFGLGDDIAKVTLQTPLNFIVPRGYQMVAQFEVENYEDYINVFNDMEFQDKNKNNEIFIRDFDYKYWTTIQVPTYENVCREFLSENKTVHYDNCERAETGTVDKMGWKDLNKSIGLQKGTITIGIFTDVQKGDKVEWIPTLFGERLTEWAGWEESWNANLISYYRLDLGSGDVVDALGNNTGTNNGATRDVSGKINDSFNFTDTNSDFVDLADMEEINTANAFTVSAWIMLNDFVDGQGIVCQGSTPAFCLWSNNGGDGIAWWVYEGVTLRQAIFFDSGAGKEPCQIGEWCHVAGTFNGTHNTVYVNGTWINLNSAWSGGLMANSSEAIRIGDRPIASNHFDGKIDEVGIWSRSLTSDEISDLYDAQKDGFENGSFTPAAVDTPPTITLNNPVNAFNSTTQTIAFNATGTDDLNLLNLSFYINGTLNQTNSSPISAALTTFFVTLAEGGYNWSVTAWDNASQSNVSSTRTFSVDTTPVIKVFSPTNISFTTSTIFFNATSTLDVDVWIVNYNTTNITLSDINTTLEVEDGAHQLLLYANNSVTGIFGLNNSINFSVDATLPVLNITNPFGVINFADISTNQTLTWDLTEANPDTCLLQYEESNHTLNCTANTFNFTIGTARTLDIFANDTFGNIASDTVTWSYLILQTSSINNASSFETAEERFTVNVTTNGSVVTAGSLTFDGTENTGATITNSTINNYSITSVIDVATNIGVSNFSFNLTIVNTIINTTIQNQIVNATTFENCAVNQTPVYINITFKNETVGEETVSAEIDADWTFWLGGGNTFKTFTFTNTTESFDVDFCLTSATNRTLNTNVSLTYDNSISEQRSFSGAFTLTNTTTNQTLFLLPTSEGVFVTFQTVTIAEQIISGVAANVTRSGDLISSGVTDDAGLVQFFLDPDTTYVFSFFKNGFDLVTTTLKPTQSSFTIVMGGVVAVIQNDTTRGISYSTSPLANTLNNNTETEFNLTFSSVFFGLDSFGFALKNSTGSVFNITTSTTGTGGFLSRNLNTGNNTDIIMEIFWTIDGNQTNVTRVWAVLDSTDEGFSIKNFFDDLNIYLTSGLFGLTSFGLGIIVFLIIIITTGVLSMKFSITNPAGISIIVFAMVLFFDVGLGIMPNPVNAVPNFPTIFVGIVLLGLFFKEAIVR